MPSPRPYHHGRLRQAVIEAAVAEVERVGAANLSMREIARRAGVSHAAPAHHFGDKAGIFTAIATEGFRLATEAITPFTEGADGFVRGGAAYVRFALEHRGHFEVMFRPELYDGADPELTTARDAAFGVLFGSAQGALGDADPDRVTGLVLAGWSLSHGFATLWLHANLQDRIGPDPSAWVAEISQGVVALGKITKRQLDRAARRR